MAPTTEAILRRQSTPYVTDADPGGGARLHQEFAKTPCTIVGGFCTGGTIAPGGCDKGSSDF